MKKKLLYVASIGILMLMIFFGTKSYQNAIEYEKLTISIIGKKDVSEQAKDHIDSAIKSIFGNLYKEDKPVDIEILSMKKEQKRAKDYAEINNIYFSILLILLMLFYLFFSDREFVIFGSLGASLALVFGLISPILMVTIHKNVEYLGDIVLSFESNGIVGSIVKLYNSDDLVVAFVILLFSVIVPILKVLSLMYVSLFIDGRFVQLVTDFFKIIGKWSMIDVYVVSVFLVYLTANKGEVSRAETEVGLYFFLAYVIVSMLVSLSADKMLSNLKDKRQKTIN